MQPNIVLITVDCWRGDHLGSHSNARAKTPNLDTLASESNYYTKAYTCGGWTQIAMTALFSSTFASMYGFSKGHIADERPLLAETLANQGYQTAGFTTNLVCGKQFGFDRGFQTFEDVRPTSQQGFQLNKVRGFQRLCRQPWLHKTAAMLGLDSTPDYPSMLAENLVDKGLNWLEKRESDQPCFLWLHFMDLHWPYRSSARKQSAQEKAEMWTDRKHWLKVKGSQGTYYPGDERAQRWQQIYAEETQVMDRALGRLFSGLKARQDWEQTAICATADHGEEFYERGSWAHSWNQLHDEGVQVPLIIHLPGQSKGRRIDHPVSHLDIAPSLLNLAKIEPDAKMLGGKLPLLFSDKPTGDIPAPVYAEMLGHRNSYKYRLCIMDRGYKYIYDGDRDRCELYALNTDPDARNNLYDRHLSIAKHFDSLRLGMIAKGALDVLKGQHIWGEDPFYDLGDDPQVIERLRALGYVD